MTDLASIKSSTLLLPIKHPGTGEPLGVTVELISLLDERMKSIKRKIMDRRLYLEARSKTFKAEDVEENGNALAFEAIVTWDWGTNTFKGKVPELDKATAYAVFNELPWFLEQINNAITETKDFFQK